MTDTTGTETGPTAESTGGKSKLPTLGLILAVIVGAEFLLQLDGTIVNVALPELQNDLGFGVVTASWVPNAFLLSFGSLLLLSGRLGDLIGHRKVFLVGIALVTVASLIAGLAPNLEVLLTGRVLQGAGAALAGPAGLALLTTIFEGARQQKAFGLYSTVTGLGAAAGMVLGGLLTYYGDWRWSLLVNVPVGALVVIIGLRSLDLSRDRRAVHSLNLPSAILATASLVLIVFALVGVSLDGWGSVRVLLPLIAGLVLVGILVAVDARSTEPLLPGRVFADRARGGSFVVLVLLASVLTGFLLYLVQYLQTGPDFSALEAGLSILPFGLGLLVTTQLLTPRLGAFSLQIRGLGGLAVVLVATLWLTQISGGDYTTVILPAIVVLGVGVGLAIVPVNMIILTTSAPEDTGIAAGLLQTSLTVGGVFGIGLLLIPFTHGTDPAEGVSSVFVWSSVVVALALAVAGGSWIGAKKSGSA